MDFENTFRVAAPIDEVYEALLDVERVAPAMPGAQVLEKSGDDAYKVAIKVKLGPVSMTYRGDVTVVDRDPQAHTATLDVKAKEARGQGSATATAAMSLAEEGAETVGTINAHVQLSGKAAAMGRGVIQDVSSRLVAQFAENLEGIVGSGGAPSEEAESATATAGNGSRAADEAPAPAREREPRAEPDGGDALAAGPLVAGMAADRLRDPRVLTGVLGAAVALGFVLGRRGR